MDITGVTRLRDGKEVDEFVVGHSDHSYWYKGRPPLTSCRECWAAFYYAQWVQGGAKREHLEQLESVIHHMQEKVQRGEWDFKPKLEIESIKHED